MKWIHLIATGVTGLLLIFATVEMPEFGDPASPASLHVSPRYIEESLAETKVPNMVTTVLADYRSYDTLGEATVIFTGALACLLILRGKRKED